jgi:hypothetical protein
MASTMSAQSHYQAMMLRVLGVCYLQQFEVSAIPLMDFFYPHNLDFAENAKDNDDDNGDDNNDDDSDDDDGIGDGEDGPGNSTNQFKNKDPQDGGNNGHHKQLQPPPSFSAGPPPAISPYGPGGYPSGIPWSGPGGSDPFGPSAGNDPFGGNPVIADGFTYTPHLPESIRVPSTSMTSAVTAPGATQPTISVPQATITTLPPAPAPQPITTSVAMSTGIVVPMPASQSSVVSPAPASQSSAASFPAPQPSSGSAIPASDSLVPLSVLSASSSLSMVPTLAPLSTTSSPPLVPLPSAISSASSPNRGRPGDAQPADASNAGAQPATMMSPAKASSLAGGIVGAILGVFVIFALVFFCLLRNRKRKGGITADPYFAPDGPMPPSSMTYAPGEATMTSEPFDFNHQRDVVPPPLPEDPFADRAETEDDDRPLPLSTPGVALTADAPLPPPPGYPESPSTTLVASDRGLRGGGDSGLLTPDFFRPHGRGPMSGVEVSVNFRDERDNVRDNVRTAEPLPLGLGSLNNWLGENRRRSRLSASSASVWHRNLS